ncbi:MAG: radical SAM protein [Anaerocolumna sp.]
MKINLYYPPLASQRFEGSNIPINTERNFNPKSALLLLGSSIRKLAADFSLCCELEIIDMQTDDKLFLYKTFPYGKRKINCFRHGAYFSDYYGKIKEAEIHGISSNFTINAHVVGDLIKYIKSVNPSSAVIVGGTDATTRPYYYLNHGADIVIYGEGEISLYKVIEAIHNGSRLDEIPNVYTKNNLHPIIDKNFCLPMDKIPLYDFSLIKDLYMYKDTGEGPAPEGVELPYICFETSRGCFNGCSFCTTPIVKGKYRTMSPTTVEKHLKNFKQNGIKTILFQEDNILSRLVSFESSSKVNQEGRNEVLEIFGLLKKYGFAWEFANGVEIGKLLVDSIPDYELIDALFWNNKEDGVHQGCYRVQIPIESFEENATKKFNKLIDFNKQIDIYKEILRAGITYQTYNFLIGYPSDTLESFENYRMKCEYLKDELYKINTNYHPYFNVFNLILLPGTQDFKRYQDMLQFDIDEYPEVFGFNLPALDTEHFKHYELFVHRNRLNNILNEHMVTVYDKTYNNLQEMYKEFEL